jgi:hypothetical protein
MAVQASRLSAASSRAIMDVMAQYRRDLEHVMRSGVVPRRRLSSPLWRRSSKSRVKKSWPCSRGLTSKAGHYFCSGFISNPFAIRRELHSIQSCGPPSQALLSHRQMLSRSPTALKNSSCYYYVRAQTITVAPKHYQSTWQDVHCTITTLASGHHSSSIVMSVGILAAVER